ncbi:Molybdopterin or thiamine biosynthesis adenylyltransferase [Malonomonas rubra DSM 5091]|uniref:Molybdopterin or thiamine biosynthesis adenylyltransferase n=1 Tax=Malonomonas rubra DSM 5091 TaxID=1122189 RepID=A0A1M6C2Y8_MALRU|nr:HesA/MoeB/ThiF family protein [Malonomonas rubra]SHI55181.1 Molybdopterin or thiamine biosynthesis adenylyltransferase [Malonomonas rubra DSM 5091]
MENRYSRQLLHWGQEKQQKIETAVMLVAGVGGLGATVAQLLVRAGVGKIYLVDDGFVDAPDLNRQLLYSEEDIGSSKLMLACDRLRRINSSVEINPLSGSIDSDFSLPADVQIVADCLDNYLSRFQLEAAIPDETYLVHAGLQGEEGQVLTLQKGRSQLLRQFYAGAEQPDGPIPVTGDTATVIAGLMCNELFALIDGQPKLLNRCLVVSLSDFHISFLDI